MLAPRNLIAQTQTAPNANQASGLHGHLPALDALRGLAILIVTAYRFRQVPTDGTWFDTCVRRTLMYGDRGVDLFFVLSGFLITGILFDAKGRERYFRNFYLRRGLRIWPLYFGVLIVALLVLPRLLAGTSSAFATPPEHSLWLWLHASNWIMAWENAWLFPTFDHFWSLAIEEQFYLVWPLAIWSLSRRGAMWTCGGCVLLAIGTRTYLIVIDQAHPAADVFTLCRLDALAAGAWLALYLRGPQGAAGLFRLTPWLLCGGGGLTLALMGTRKILPPGYELFGQILRDNDYVGLALLFAGLLLVALHPHAGFSRWFWHHPWLQAAGKYSYGWYVFQGLIQPDMLQWGLGASLVAWSGSAVLGRGAQILVGGGLSLALAIASWQLYERHFLRLKDHWAPSPARS